MSNALDTSPNPPNGGLWVLRLEDAIRSVEARICKLPGRRLYVPPGQIIFRLLLNVMYQEMEAIAVMSISKHKNTTSISAFCLTEIVMTFCAMSLSDPRAERETKPSYLVF